MFDPTAQQLPLELPAHHNQGLFSDYYLNVLVPGQANWLPLTAEARPVYEALRARLAAIHPAELDEAQLEEQWIKAVLEQLGWHYSVQVKIRFGPTGNRRPDYALTASADQARALTSQIYAPAELRAGGVLAVADAKKWGIHLDQAARGERNPSQQIDEYLRYSELPWGILTDGRTWRLYERDTSKNNVYYAVNLIDLLSRDDIEPFLYFYAFFRQVAFTPGGWLDTIRASSTEYAEKLSDTLEEQVYDALELIAQGFLEYRRNKLTPKSETLHAIYEQSLVLLYRLLFIFYAESRDVLPMHPNDRYRRHLSLSAIKTLIADNGGADLDADGDLFYGRLKTLFFAIDQGNAGYELPAYNGRLFSADEHPFLDKKGVGDKYLAPAIDKMARVPNDAGKLVFVDYRDLEVRHLGAIYEKLLEYQLDRAETALTVKEALIVPAAPGDPIAKHAGQVYLRTGNNQRKVTGSYYTPDYIVRFIVERTLEPMLMTITERYATRDAEGHWAVREPGAVRDAILALNVLDPATGSGHFMVDAAAYIAEWLRGLALAPVDLGAEDELLYWKRQVVSSCIYGVDLNPLAVELAKLSLWLATLAKGKPLSFLDHHVKPGNSLVGARGAEIGLLSEDAPTRKRKKPHPPTPSPGGHVGPPLQRREGELRAEDAQPDSPLSFGRGAGGEGAPEQLSLLQESDFAPAVRFAIGQMSAIEHTIAERVEQVKQQEQMYAELSEKLAVWRHIADIWTARGFDVKFDGPSWRLVVQELRGEGVGLPWQLEPMLKRAEQAAADHRFFHWELVFPEVFFEPDGTSKAAPGFDAVVGNPPYVRQEQIVPIKPFLSGQYKIYQGTADLFLYFYEQGLRLLKPGARLGYITSGTYMNSNSATTFRQYIHDNAALETVLNFGENQPFRGAEMVYPTMVVMRKGQPAQTFRSLFIEGTLKRDEMEPAVDRFDEEAVESLSKITAMDEWRFQPAELTGLFQKITKGYTPLSATIDNRIYYGIKTGLNDAFMIDSSTRAKLLAEHTSSAEIIKPMLRGEDLRPWHSLDSNQYLIFAYHGIKIQDYPAVLRHLEQFHQRLAQRAMTGSEWYELQTAISYRDIFEKSKVFWPEIAKLPRFSVDTTGFYANNKCYLIASEPYSTFALLALLQSRVSWFTLSQISTPLRLRAGLWQYQLFRQFVERLPIPDLTGTQESQLAEIAEKITVLARDRYQMHEAMRRRITADLGAGGKLNEKLEAWWLLPGGVELRAEVKKAFKRDIPLTERDDWDKYLADRKTSHSAATAEIVALETRLNAIVYEAFSLTPDEIALIERTTKYPYGEV